jgi:hypothetical protein
MKTILFLCTGLVLLCLCHSIDAQSVTKKSDQKLSEKKASKTIHKPTVETAHNATTYDGPVIVNTHELGEKMRDHSHPGDKVIRPHKRN